MEDEIPVYPLQKPGHLRIYPLVEIQDFEDESNEQSETMEESQW